MRILCAFFSVIFTFINPVMIYKVVYEVESFLNTKQPQRLRIAIIDFIVEFFVSNGYSARLKTIVYLFVLGMTVLHIAITCFSLYGIYSCRPAFMRPILIDIAVSFTILFSFVAFYLSLYWHINTVGSIADHDVTKSHLRNVYIGGGFLIFYVVWLLITIAAYVDTKKLRADFMYWIVEERMSMRSRHNVSVDNRSDRSSKGSKASRTSKGSARSETRVYTRAESVTVSLEGAGKRQSLVHTRLSVPL